MTRRFLAAALLVLAATLAHAQQLPPGKWWQRPQVVNELKLTDEQQTRLDAIFRQHAPALIDSKGDVEKLAIELRGELDQSKLDRAAIQKIAARLSDARGKLFEREIVMLVDMRAVLTEPQWGRMRQFLEREHRPPMDGGRPMGQPHQPGRRPD